MKEDLVFEIIEKLYTGKESLIPILEEIQKEYRYLPKESLEKVSEKTGRSLTEIYGVATFYKSFSLVPKGKNIITVCVGTACHVRGGSRIVDAVSSELKIKPGETTQDMNFTLETVNCLGCCAIGPVVVINGEYFGEMTPQKTLNLIKKIENGEEL